MIKMLISTNKYFLALQLQNTIPRRFKNRQKARETIITQQDRIIEYNPWQALQLLRVHSFTSFPQTIDICVRLGVNPKNGNQIVRGTATMPSGLGKEVTIAVLCQKQMRETLQAAGANIFIDEEGLKKIQKGEINFDKLFCTPQMLHLLKPFSKILGPKGFMPNIKVGTLVAQQKLAAAIKEAKEGQITFRVDNGKNIHAPLGKISFTDDQILKNLKSLMLSLQQKRPQSFKKGKYFMEAYIKTTMGPRWKLKIQQINPVSQENIWTLI